MAIYLTMIALFSVLFGLAVDQVYTSMGFHARAMVGQAAEWIPPWAQLLGGALLLLLSVRPLLRGIRAKLGRDGSEGGPGQGEGDDSAGSGTEGPSCGCSSCSGDQGSGLRDNGSGLPSS